MKIDINIAAGMELERDVFQNDANIVLLRPAGTILTSKDIERMKRHGVTEVYVKNVELIDTFPKELQEKASEAILEADFKTIINLAETYENIALETSFIRNDMSKFISTNLEEVSPLLLCTIGTPFAVTIAKKYNETFGKEFRISLKDIAIASMLQDIGLTVSDNELYFSSLSTTYEDDFEHLMKKYSNLKKEHLLMYKKDFHAIYSYYIAKGNHFSPVIEKAILMHGEAYKMNGKNSGILGIDLKSEEDQIAANMAMILKAVDTYVRLLFVSKEKNNKIPFQLVPKYLELMVADGTLSPEVVNVLKEVLPLYPPGTNVMLNDGTIAMVIRNDKNFPLKPKIATLRGKNIEYEDNLQVLYPLSKDECSKRLHR